MKKRAKIGFAVTGAIVLLLLAVYGVVLIIDSQSNLPRNSIEVYETNWEIKLPDGLQEQYRAQSPTSFHGDGERYTIYQVTDITESFFDDFSNETDAKAETEITDILSSLEVPTEKWPDLRGAITWKKLEKHFNQLYLVCDTSKSELYLIERLQ